MAALLLAGGFVANGYWISDARTLALTSNHHQLTTPAKAFAWLTVRYHQAKPSDPVLASASIQSMLNRPSRRLWCDEGALVLALIIQAQGGTTRLVDLLDRSTGISHHTTLQVKQHGTWVTYDFTSKTKAIPLAATVPYAAIPRYRNYPATPGHWLLLNNGYLRELAHWLRAHTRSPNSR